MRPISILLVLLAFLERPAAADTLLVFGQEYSDKPAIRFVGDRDYPPIEWLEDDSAKGIFPSFLPSLSEAMGRRIEYRLMDWKRAQQQVLAGEADVLTVFSPNEDRKEHYDFVPGFLEFEMSLFVRKDNVTIYGIDDLKGINTGITKGGFLRRYMEHNSTANLIVIDNHLSGFRQLLSGEVDAIATTKWVGAYTIQKYGLKGIKVLPEAMFIKDTHLGIRKGDELLAQALSEGMKALHSNGELKRLNDEWNGHQVVYLTERKVRSIYHTAVIAILLFVIAVAVVFILILRRTVRLRTAKLQQSNATLEQTVQHLEQTQSQLVQSEKMAALGNLVSGVAHEINTPLGVAITLTSTLSESTEDLEQLVLIEQLDQSQLAEYLEHSGQSLSVMSRSLDQAARLINSFKELAVDQGDEERHEFDLVRLVDTTILLFKTTISEKVLTINLTGISTLSMNSYPSALQRALLAILNNCVVHGFEDRNQGEIVVTITQSGPNAVLTIIDNGKGFAPSDIERVFNPFFTTRFGQGGSGLGLSIVHSIVSDLLKGSVSAENQQGACIRITVPVDPGLS